MEIIKKLSRYWDRVIVSSLCVCLAAGAMWMQLRYINTAEWNQRMQIIQEAERWLGAKESDGSHKPIIDLYNSKIPLARGYTVTYQDSWCAAFISAVAISCNQTDRIPTECSCQQQILLFEEMGRWVEDDRYLPKPGDIIYYAWDDQRKGDCTGWADHVGIVTETFGPILKVIEGNKNDDVSYRYLFLNDPTIRGFAIPDYTS